MVIYLLKFMSILKICNSLSMNSHKFKSDKKRMSWDIDSTPPSPLLPLLVLIAWAETFVRRFCHDDDLRLDVELRVNMTSCSSDAQREAHLLNSIIGGWYNYKLWWEWGWFPATGWLRWSFGPSFIANAWLGIRAFVCYLDPLWVSLIGTFSRSSRVCSSYC